MSEDFVEDDEFVDETEVEAEKARKEAEVERRLQAAEQSSAEAKALAKLMADPQVRAVLDAKARGEEVSVTQKNRANEEVTPEEFQFPEETETLTNRQLLELMGKMVSSTMKKTVGSIVEEKVKPLQERVEGVTSVVQSTQRETINQQIREMEGRFEDFASLKPQMAELSGQNPGLSLEELYFLTKARVGGGFKSLVRRVDTERPSDTSARPAVRTRKEPLPNGREGIKQLLEESLRRRDIQLPGEE